MTSSQMDLLDAQMAQSVERLDRRVGGVDVPPFDPSGRAPSSVAEPRRSHAERWIAVAATVALLATAVALVAVRDDGGGVADADDPAAMVLSDDRAGGFDDISAYEVPEASGSEPDVGDAWLHAPVGSEFPWPDVLIETVVPTDALSDGGANVRDGRLVDLGGVDGYVDGRAEMVRVRWFTAAGDVHAIGSTTIPYDELERIARSFVDSGREPGTMPEFEVLAETEPWAFASVSEYAGIGGPPTPAMSGVMYDAVTGRRSVLQVTTILGDAGDWRVATAEWSDADLVSARGGRPGFVGVADEGILPAGATRFLSVSWLQGDQTFVVATLLGEDGEPDRLLSLVEDLETLDEAAWDAFLAEHGVDLD